jgi:hypothetical protein
MLPMMMRPTSFSLVVEVRQLELPGQVVVERRRLGERRLERRQVLAVAAVRRHRRGARVVVEVVLPVDLVDRGAVGLDLDLVGVLDRRLLERRQLGVARALHLHRELVVAPEQLALLALLGRDLEVVFEDRVLEHLLVDHIHELHPGQLKQLDRLLELRRHDELLTQSQLLAHLHAHRRSSFKSVSLDYSPGRPSRWPEVGISPTRLRLYPSAPAMSTPGAGSWHRCC